MIMASTKITADIPAEATPEQRIAIVAGAYQAALSMASSDADIRLRMILGEANQKYEELARWVWEQVEKDEAKAPGLTALLEQLVITGAHNEWMRRGGRLPEGVTLTRLMEKAIPEAHADESVEHG
jgi:hypothetical protein